MENHSRSFMFPTEAIPMFVDCRQLSPTTTTLAMLSVAFDKAGDRTTATILLGLAYVLGTSTISFIENDKHDNKRIRTQP